MMNDMKDQDEAAVASNPAFLVSSTGKIATWNSTCRSMLGYTEQEILHHPLNDLIIAADRAAVAAHLEQALPQPLEVDLSLRQADYGEIASRLTLLPQFGKSGRLIGYVALIIRDGHIERMGLADEVGNIPLKSMMNLIAGPFLISNADGRFVLWNESMAAATGKDAEQLGGMHLTDLFRAEEWLRLQPDLEQVMAHGVRLCVETQIRSRGGCAVPHLVSAMRLAYGGKHYLCAMGFDISERRREQRSLLVRDRALHAVSNGIVICRSDGRDSPIEYVNPAFERITGFSAAESLGRDPRFMAAPGLDDDERHRLRAAIDARLEINVVFRNLRKDGELFWNDLSITPVRDEQGEVSHFIGLVNDVTALKQRTAHLEHEVNHDPLTGLANRNLLWDRLEQALQTAQRNKSLVATILLDLNKFKCINDTMGHEVGDEVLKVVAKRLQASVRATDTVARLSGDEFVLVLADQPSLRFALRMIERVRGDLSKPIQYNDKEIPVCGAIGVSVYPHDGLNAYDLVRAADTAMYHSKEAGKGDVHFFSVDMKSSTDAKRALEAEMREALEGGQLFLLFQPRQSLSTARVTGVEALLRWRHPQQGVLLPAAFLGDAEENGMIVPFGEWVLQQVCLMLLRFKAAGRVDLPITINSSYREFCRGNYISHIAAKLDEFQLAPASLELDIREETLLRNPHLNKPVLEQIRQLGVSLAIDDFGAGLSNLRYLQELPMQRLKISRGSVGSICPVTNTGDLARTLIGIGRSLHLPVVAEGVESLSQQNFLRQNGCDEMQGNFFREPMTEAELRLMLEMA
ncbi:EAL domain-containing protein [Rugamonas sp. CCM 8940]|uniref:sensor domain-containing protein n=1 Tax=Rugamonas sp. CCM 8940 TaxID=2765359 RepID=UPI0018F659B7|nr:bifunctional diguanylate cyclase/phosphodiesterase [Rugamonas sp. CCM 8940]MBJ7310976.1 EAL domain-containing protein [Rugamonas sp. CCM 8940]